MRKQPTRRLRPWDGVSPEIKTVEYWRGRFDAIGEPATVKEFEQLDAMYQRIAVAGAPFEKAHTDYRAREAVARPLRAEKRSRSIVVATWIIAVATVLLLIWGVGWSIWTRTSDNGDAAPALIEQPGDSHSD